MAIATEALEAGPWSLPERLSWYPGVTLRSTIEPESTGLSDDELVRVNLCAIEAVVGFVDGARAVNSGSGFSMQREKREGQDLYRVTHHGMEGQTSVQAGVLREPGSGYTPVFVLFDASRVEQARA